MPTELTMPQLSDTMTEGTLVKWNVKEGDKVKAGQEIADIETDKATMPMESFESGTLAVILIKEGEKVSVGGAIGVIASSSEKVDDVKARYVGGAKASGSKAAPPVQSVAVEKSESKPGHTGAGAIGTATIEEASSGEVHDLGDTLHGATRETILPPEKSSHASNGSRVRISPLAKRIATDKGIDPKLVSGTGPGGRIVQKDVLTFRPPAPKPATAGASEKKKGPPPLDLSPRLKAGEKQSIPLTKMRSVIANRLQQSKQTIPHFYETIDIDVTDLSKLREQMNKALELEGLRLSIGDLIAKAIAKTLLVHPGLNAHWKETEIIRHGDVNLGMAVALPEGLIVPVLRGINTLSLKEIRTKSADLIDRARKQNLKQTELSGATFTVSNLGTFGIREFSAIINPPEVGILAIGSAEDRAVVRNGQIVIRTMMTVTLSADHRAVDGASAADFLKTLRLFLEEPGTMLV